MIIRIMVGMRIEMVIESEDGRASTVVTGNGRVLRASGAGLENDNRKKSGEKRMTAKFAKYLKEGIEILKEECRRQRKAPLARK
jgi:hypothetical protein